MNAEVNSVQDGDQINVKLTHSLDPALYDLPITLNTYVPSGWEIVKVRQGGKSWFAGIVRDESGRYVRYQAAPNAETIELIRVDSE